jgi:hypothetical protein
MAEADAQGDTRTPFQRFQDLTRKLVRVPKAEVDAQREQERPKPSGSKPVAQ